MLGGGLEKSWGGGDEIVVPQLPQNFAVAGRSALQTGHFILQSLLSIFRACCLTACVMLRPEPHLPFSNRLWLFKIVVVEREIKRKRAFFALCQL
jgi:hypothetical protein